MSHCWIVHNSHELYYRNPFGTVPCNHKILLKIKIRSKKPPKRVILRLWHNGREKKIEMKLIEKKDEVKIYCTHISAPAKPGLLWYYFIITKQNHTTIYYGNNPQCLGGIGQVYCHEPPSYQITVHKEDLCTPNWFKEAVIYQIFVDRFYNGNEDGRILNPKKRKAIYHKWNEAVPLYCRDPETGKIIAYDFFGGNLLGVIKKLPYLKKLGVNVIYFNPIFESPSNHKYDTSDYKKIDPMFGNNQLFKELCSLAGEMGISIILDGVFSHTGSDSIYFNKEGNYPSLGACQSKDSPYYKWYRFYEYPDKYECWWGIDTLPNVNEMEPSYQNFIIHDDNSVLKYWMRMGAKGWRLDVADELPDEFIKAFRKTMKEVNPESVLIGEVWEDASNKISYGKMRNYLLGDELDSVTNYPFRSVLLDYILGRKSAQETHLHLMKLYENYPLHHFYSTMNLISSHDVPRVLTLLGGAPPKDLLSKEEQARFRLKPEQKKLGISRLKLLSLFQMTFPGVPCIYYGDEAGMEGYADPLNRGCYPWGKENQELLSWYKKVISLRNRYDVFKTGKWIAFYADGDVYGFIRCIEKGRDVFNQKRKDNTAVVLFNRNPQKTAVLSIDVSRWCKTKLVDVINEEELILKEGILDISLNPLEGKVLIQNP